MTESSEAYYGNYRNLRKLSGLDFDFIRLSLSVNLCFRIWDNVSDWIDL